MVDSSCGIRDPNNVLRKQHIAWPGVCKQIRGIIWNSAGIRTKTWCQNRSIRPVSAAVFDLNEL